MDIRQNWQSPKRLFLFLATFSTILAFYWFVDIDGSTSYDETKNEYKSQGTTGEPDIVRIEKKWRVNETVSYREIQSRTQKFYINSSDVIVFIHIQKTAGTSFEKFLVKELNITSPCLCRKGRKKCVCPRNKNTNETWLFSRYSTGWACGLHADYTELYAGNCVDRVLDVKEGFHHSRRYFFTSFLRNPVDRFISEYRHVNRGATWTASRHICNGRMPDPDELPFCFDPQIGWDDVTLDEFLNCPYNLAFNRQTRMLADLTLVNCYSKLMENDLDRDKIMLESAMKNLENLAYYGIKEYMNESQIMFENLFDMRFIKNLSDWSRSKSNDTVVSNEQYELIRRKNSLDIQLYKFAVQLFQKRLKEINKES